MEQVAVTLKSEIERGLSGSEFRESTRKSRRKFNENIHRPDVEDLDVPVTEEEEVLARYIE